MANLKNITELPVAESAEGLNLIVNDNGIAKQIIASSVGTQSDWAETDENNPAFIKNKPVEKYNIDIDIQIDEESGNNYIDNYNVNYIESYESLKNKIENNEKINVRIRLKISTPMGVAILCLENFEVGWFPAGYFNND